MIKDTGKTTTRRILNLPVGGDVATSTDGKDYIIRGLPWIRKTDFGGVTKVTAVAEVQQYVTVTMPTIAASTRYEINAAALRNMGGDSIIKLKKQFGATSAAVLSGTAATDKANVAAAIARAFNNNMAKLSTNPSAPGYVGQAIAGYTSTATSATAAATPKGAYIKGNTSGAYGYVAVGGASIVILTISGTFTNETVTNQTLGTTSALTVVTVVGNLGILDLPGYYPAVWRGKRGGATAVFAGTNIASTAIAVTAAAVYGIGQGTRMLDDVPVQDRFTDNFQKGVIPYSPEEVPVAGQGYTTYCITENRKVNDNSANSSQSIVTQRHYIYAYDGAAGYSAFDTAILALT